MILLPKFMLGVVTIHKENIHNRKNAPLAESWAVWVDCAWCSGTWQFHCFLVWSEDLWKSPGFLHRILSLWMWNLSLRTKANRREMLIAPSPEISKWKCPKLSPEALTKINLDHKVFLPLWPVCSTWAFELPWTTGARNWPALKFAILRELIPKADGRVWTAIPDSSRLNPSSIEKCKGICCEYFTNLN